MVIGWLIVLCLAAAHSGQVPEKPAEADLAAGIQQVKDGDFETGLLTLDTVSRRLTAAGAQPTELSRAHLYLGIAYLALGSEPLARGKFQAALKLDPSLRLDAGEFSPKVLRAFDAARSALVESEALSKQAKTKRGRGGLILVGLGGLAAAGVTTAAVTSSSPPKNSPPAATITVSPDGPAVANVTTLSFTASGTDPDSDPLSYAWNFGDGSTAAGATTTHVYPTEGTFNVALTASDAKTSTTVTRSVIVSSLTGTWRLSAPDFLGQTSYVLQQAAGRITGNVPGLSEIVIFDGTVVHPASVAFEYSVRCPRNTGWRGCTLTFRGQLATGGQTLAGNGDCEADPGDGCFNPPGPLPAACRLCLGGRSGAMTLTR